MFKYKTIATPVSPPCLSSVYYHKLLTHCISFLFVVLFCSLYLLLNKDFSALSDWSQPKSWGCDWNELVWGFAFMNLLTWTMIIFIPSIAEWKMPPSCMCHQLLYGMGCKPSSDLPLESFSSVLFLSSFHSNGPSSDKPTQPSPIAFLSRYSDFLSEWS